MNTTRITGGPYLNYRQTNLEEHLTHSRIHPNGGVRGGTLRLLPVDSKAEAKRSNLYPSQEPPAQTNPKLK